MDANEILNQLVSIAVEYGPKLLGAIVVWIVGSRIIKFLLKSFEKMLDKGKTDTSLKPFFKSIIWSTP